MNTPEIILLEPHITHNIWGGTKLREVFGYNEPGEDLGECWGIAAHPAGSAVVKNGKYLGMTLRELYENHPELFGNISLRHFPLLVKIIDAKDDLSIQVHPDDAYAYSHENGSLGKSECWYILDAEQGAKIILGHCAKTREELVSMIEAAKFRELIREVPVEKGDFIVIEPGTIHAIKGGITLLETQQNSDITYRLYDYDRLWKGAKRPLHIRESEEVINVPSPPAETCMIRRDELDGRCPENVLTDIYSGAHFRIFRLELSGECEFLQQYPFLNMSIVEGEAELKKGTDPGSRTILLHKGDHLIIPAGFGTVTLRGNAEIICSTVGNQET